MALVRLAGRVSAQSKAAAAVTAEGAARVDVPLADEALRERVPPPSLLESRAAKTARPFAAAPQASGSGAQLSRLAGCYALDPVAITQGSANGDSAAALLPSRVELLTGPVSLVDGSVARALRPAPGAAPFSAATRASWEPLGDDRLALQVENASRVVKATLVVAGDSVSGEAVVQAKEGAAPRTAVVRGRKVPCSNP